MSAQRNTWANVFTVSTLILLPWLVWILVAWLNGWERPVLEVFAHLILSAVTVLSGFKSGAYRRLFS